MRRTTLILLGIVITAAASARPRPVELLPFIDLTPSHQPFAPPISAGMEDTVYFGGTTWAPDSMRWEALRDSVWTFESGVGSSINTGQNPGKPIGHHDLMEGWFGVVPNQLPSGVFERSTTCAISGAYSLWAGVDDSAATSAPCYLFAAGQGYGNSWWITRAKTFSYPGSGSVTLSYKYSVECEPSFDYAYAVIDTSGDGSSEITLATYTGIVDGVAMITLTPGINMRSTPGDIRILFEVQSDGSYSDEDGLYPTTCGHTVIDDVVLSGAINDVSSFESGEDGWVSIVRPPDGGLSNLSAISDLPPMQVQGPCGVSDSVLVFHNQSFRIPYDGGDMAISPWIDLRRNESLGRPGKVLTFDLYWQESPFNMHSLFVSIAVRSQSPPCEEFDDVHDYWFGSTPWCSSSQPVMIDLSSFTDAGADQIQIAMGLWYPCGVNCTPVDAWFDNVRFGVYGPSTSAAPESPDTPATRLLGAEPNPLVSTARIRFTLRNDAHASLVVYDVAGRRVRTLVDSPMLAGSHEITWDGRDDEGRRVPAGLYFYRLTAGEFSEARKVVVR